MLGEAGGEVRVVVLDRDRLDALARERGARREVVGVLVVDDDLGRDREQALEVLDPRLVGLQHLVGLEVADVVRDPRPRALRDAERALQLRPAGEQRPRRATGSASASGTNPRERRISSGRRSGTARSTESSVRVWIGRSWSSSRSAMPVEPAQRVVVLVRDRLVGDVAARHHQRLPDVGEQQVVQRRVRQQHAEVGGARRDRGRHRRVRPPRREHDRAVAAGQQRRLLAGQRDELPRRLDVATMTANGLSSRCLRARSAATAGSRAARQARW